jgi:hypothetical protein
MSHDQLRCVPFLFLWKVEEFLSKAESHLPISSPEFVVVDPLDEAKDLRFSLVCYPRSRWRSQDSVGLYLNYLSKTSDVRVNFNLFVLDERGKRVKSRLQLDQLFSKRRLGHREWGFRFRSSMFDSNTAKVHILSSTVQCRRFQVP